MNKFRVNFNRRLLSTEKKIAKIKYHEFPIHYKTYLSKKELSDKGSLVNSIAALENELSKSSDTSVLLKILLSCPLPLKAEPGSKTDRVKREQLFQNANFHINEFESIKIHQALIRIGKHCLRKSGIYVTEAYWSMFGRDGSTKALQTENERLYWFQHKVLVTARVILDTVFGVDMTFEDHPMLKFQAKELGSQQTFRRFPDTELRFSNLATIMLELKKNLPSSLESQIQKLADLEAFYQNIEYMLIKRTPYGIITNAEKTIIFEIESTNIQSKAEVTLNVRAKILKFDDPVLTKISVLLWWFLHISSIPKKEVIENERNMGLLQKRLLIKETERNSMLHEAAVKYCEAKTKETEILKINIEKSINDVFKPLVNGIYDGCQILDIDGNTFAQKFSYSSQVPKKVRLMVFDPIRGRYDAYENNDERELQKENESEKEYNYQMELKSYSNILHLRLTSDHSINQAPLLTQGFIFISEKQQYRYCGYFIAYGLSEEPVIDKYELAKRQMNILHQNGVSCIPTSNLRESDMGMINGKFCFLRASDTTPTLLEEEKETLAEFFQQR